MKLRVIKLGGSLFDLPDLADRISNWVRQQASLPTFLIAGGGPFADSVRLLDQTHQLPSDISHDLALRSNVTLS